MLGAAIGAVAGLVAITPGRRLRDPGGAVLIGFGVGIVCYGAVAAAPAAARRRRAGRVRRPRRRRRSRCAWRPASSRSIAVNAAGLDGLLAGNPGQLVVQLLGVGVVAFYSAAATAAILSS